MSNITYITNRHSQTENTNLITNLLNSLNRDNRNFYMKRAFDITVAGTLLVLLAPMFLLLAILIKLDSKGSAFFSHKRVGGKRQVVNGRVTWVPYTFSFYKFRSMREDTDETLHQAHIAEYINSNGEGEVETKVKNDPRVTKIGRFIRKTSLDELPQLFNVLKGDMSLVGPRPVPTYEFESYDASAKRRANALGGITGLWQVKGRCLTTFAEQVQLDIDYVEEQSFLLDIKILLLTVPAVLKGKGAA